MKSLIAIALLALALPAAAQNITAPPPTVPAGITVHDIKVPGPSLAGNLEGNDTAREVMVVLPPGYAANPNKRYPVVYYLHGFAIDAAEVTWWGSCPTCQSQPLRSDSNA